MLLLRYLLLISAGGLFAAAAWILINDLYKAYGRKRTTEALPPPVRWREAGKLAALAWLPLLAGLSIVVVPSGRAGVRVSQISGTLPGTLYPGAHFVVPLVQQVETYDACDRVFATAVVEDLKKKAETLKVQTKEGLAVSLAIAVRYRIDPKRLDYIHATLPQPL